jgi:hypothetical protein
MLNARNTRHEAGLDQVVVHGIEGPAWTAAEAAAGLSGCRVEAFQ